MVDVLASHNGCIPVEKQARSAVCGEFVCLGVSPSKWVRNVHGRAHVETVVLGCHLLTQDALKFTLPKPKSFCSDYCFLSSLSHNDPDNDDCDAASDG